MVVAHAKDLIDTWGFAYAGGVIGLVVVGLVIVRTEIVQRTRAATTTSTWRIPRWWLAVGFACGASLGLGSSRLADRLLADTPDPAAVATSLCRALAQPDRLLTSAIEVHDDTDHLARDLDDTALIDAHAQLDDAIITQTPNDLRSALTAMITEIRRIAPDANLDACPPA